MVLYLYNCLFYNKVKLMNLLFGYSNVSGYCHTHQSIYETNAARKNKVLHIAQENDCVMFSVASCFPVHTFLSLLHAFLMK